ncbi:unnamed protein product [Caenorhabditis auriculariae]|uniref:PDZ domain-containing protein n=1 Tax=Caenorhabditis auriculariae TaxID=2777116 RepID=A0A8S1HM80_9PELO|nr:unnamed protein product [Caenorhabditis auriculariae]
MSQRDKQINLISDNLTLASGHPSSGISPFSNTPALYDPSHLPPASIHCPSLWPWAFFGTFIEKSEAMGRKLAVFFSISSLAMVVSAAETCLSQPQLFGVIFGSVGAAFLICAVIAVLLWICLRRSQEEKKTEEKSAYANAACDVEDRGVDAKKTSLRNKMTMIDSFKLRKKGEDVGTQKAYSMEYINEVDGKVGVQLSGEDIGGLGFNIQGNMNEGIYVRNLVPKGIAEECGNILIGDRIKSLTIIYASPYKVKLELERKMAESTGGEDSDDDKDVRYHPLFRSNTMTHVHFNPLGSATVESPKPARSASAETTQKHELPRKSESTKVAEPDSTITDLSSSEKSGADADASQMESSDYASDNTSEYRESETDGAASDKTISTQKTLSDRIEITDIIFDTIKSPTPPPHKKLEHCTELPPKQKKVIHRSPSPKVAHKPPPSPKVNRATSPQKQVTVEDSTQTVPKPVPISVAVPTQTEATLQEAPIPPPISSIPVRNEVQKPAKSTPTPPKAPEITEARVSRIPKRAESIKTPIVERKLPSLPKSITQRSHSADKSDNVWSRLYLEKKGQLRKTRDPLASPTPSGQPSPAAPATSPQPPRSQSSNPRVSEDKYGTLNRERRDRLAANDAELERQREELRKLGIL